MDLEAIETRTNAATQGPWDAAKIAACLHTARTDVPDLVARVRELEEENQRLRADLERGTTFVLGKTMDTFVRVTREPYHDNGPKWFVRSIGPTERHDDVTAALSRARDIAKEDTHTP